MIDLVIDPRDPELVPLGPSADGSKYRPVQVTVATSRDVRLVAGGFVLGGAKVDEQIPVGGSLTVSVPATDGAEVLAADRSTFEYVVTLTWSRVGKSRDTATRTFRGLLPTSLGSTVQVTELVNSEPLPAPYTSIQDIIDGVADITDPATAGLVGTASATRTALDNRFPLKLDSNGDPVARAAAARKNALTGWFHASGFPTVQAALDAAGAVSSGAFNSQTGKGPTVYVDGMFTLTAPLTIPSGVRVLGGGRRYSRLVNNTTDLIQIGAGQVVLDAQFSHLSLETGPSGGHVISLSGDGILRTSAFNDVRFLTRNQASSLLKQRDAAQVIACTWDNADLDHQQGSTVPAWDVDTANGSTHNSNRYVNSWAHGHNTDAVPFFRIKAGVGWHYNLTFDNVCGEQNGGGFIHLHAVDGATIDNCPDWDLVPAYTDDVFKFLAVGATGCKNIEVSKSYRIANPGGLTAGKFDVNASSTTNANIRVHRDCTPPGLTLTTSLNGGGQIVGLSRAFKVTTATAYTLLDTDPEVLVFNAATAVTLNLGGAAAAKYGRSVILKNIGAGTVTTSQLVDGAAFTLTTGQFATLLVDGPSAALGTKWVRIA